MRYGLQGPRKAWLVAWLAVFLAFAASYTPDAKAQFPQGIYTPQEVLLNYHFDRPVRARLAEGKYYVLDDKANRLCAFDLREYLIAEIPDPASASHKLKGPIDFVIGRDHRIYVLEAGNRRVTIFDLDGTRMGGFASPELSLGIAVNSRRNVILNQPLRGSLFTIYESSGKVRGSFGALRVPPSSFSVHAHHDRTETYNRAHFVVDPADNVYVAWWYEPRVQKYTGTGQLVWDHEFTGKEVDRFTQMASQKAGYYKFNGATVILSGITFDSSSGLLFVLFPSRTVYVFDKTGKQVSSYSDTRGKVWPFNSLAVGERGKLLFTDTFRGVYSVSMSELVKTGKEAKSQ